MKHTLIGHTGRFFKANLHCHTNLSDGNFTPEKVKEEYKKHGYSAVAFTDHDVFIPHNDLSDDTFTALNGFEAEITESGKSEFKYAKTCHICFIAKDPDIVNHPLWHRSKYLYSNARNHRADVKFDESLPDYEREYTGACISDMMRRGKAAGFFVTYNHPIWSMETYAEYSNYSGMDAMEIYNNGSFSSGFAEYVPQIYDEFLRQGKKIYCTSTDDNHNYGDPDAPNYDSFGGFTYIEATDIGYKTLTDALSRGDFYASRGPVIESLTYDDETRTIELICSPVSKITVSNSTRRTRNIMASTDELTHASVVLEEGAEYFRISIQDAKGKTADTRAYFPEDLKK